MVHFEDLVVLVKTNCSTVECFLWKQTLRYVFFLYALDRGMLIRKEGSLSNFVYLRKMNQTSLGNIGGVLFSLSN